MFDENRYWDVFVEYFKAAPDDILVQITIHNRGPEAAALHVLPQLWFRNTWSWNPPMAKPEISAQRLRSLVAEHPELGTYYLYVEDARRAAVLRERNQRRAPVWSRIPGLLQRRFSRVPGAWESVGGESAAARFQGVRAPHRARGRRRLGNVPPAPLCTLRIRALCRFRSDRQRPKARVR